MKRMTCLGWLLAFCSSTVFSETPGKRLSTSDALLKDAEVLQRKPVLIYYANDQNLTSAATSATKNELGVLRVFKDVAAQKGAAESLKKVATTIVQSLEQEAVEFPHAVNTEMNHLRSLFCSQRAPMKIGLVLVRNWGSVSVVDTRFASVKKTLLRYEYCLPAKEGEAPVLQTRYVEREWNADYVEEMKQSLLTQHLAHPQVLESFLKDVASVFPPNEYRFAFFGKTRGTKSYFFEGPTTDTYSKKQPGELLPVVMASLYDVQALPEKEASSRAIAAIVYNEWQKLDPSPPENPDANQFLEKGTFLQFFLSALGGPELQGQMHFSHVVFDSSFAPVELSPLRNARDFLGEPQNYSNVNIDKIDYLHLRARVTGYQHFSLDRLFPPGRPLPTDFMEHFGKHIEAAP